jgi:hypothetical protein
MKFSNYCIVILGDIKGSKEDIMRICETPANFLLSKGLIISTFSSALTIPELNDYFKFGDRNFVLFEMIEGSYGAFIKNEAMNNQLFNSITKKNNKVLEDLSQQLISDIINSTYNKDIFTSSATTTTHKIVVNSKINDISIEEEVNSLSESEKLNLINKIIDKGIDNINDTDKKYLAKLSKNK